MSSTASQHPVSLSKSRLFWKGTIAMLPLTIAVLPWGLLAGSFAAQSGLTFVESQALSAILFAGAAQLVATGMIKAGAGLTTMLLTTLFITSRHLLYSVSMRGKIKDLSTPWRLTLGFLLTDELFALCGKQSHQEFHPWFALGAGASFYLCWNIASLIGILAGNSIPEMDQWGLEFAVAATFIAIVIPTIKSKPVLVSVTVALFLSVALSLLELPGALIISSVTAMIAGYLTEVWGTNRS
ncbi:AzlC family ABC transporter permease [Vibrio olivae]|uniref:AzlC family ABC transporter permease n=1 Tax=Vibrio olivae TaxID=1243002 RepID=A0ABV5HNE3_9VIBR